MKILVAYETIHGSTESIAENIGRALGRHAVVTVCPMHRAPCLDRFDAFVFGSAEIDGEWLPQACTFLQRSAHAVGDKPVWLFSVGLSDARPRPLRGVSRRRERDKLCQCATRVVTPRDQRVFSGFLASERVATHRINRLLPRARLVRPGDYREWPQIMDWARQITTDLTRPAA